MLKLFCFINTNLKKNTYKHYLVEKNICLCLIVDFKYQIKLKNKFIFIENCL